MVGPTDNYLERSRTAQAAGMQERGTGQERGGKGLPVPTGRKPDSASSRFDGRTGKRDYGRTGSRKRKQEEDVGSDRQAGGGLWRSGLVGRKARTYAPFKESMNKGPQQGGKALVDPKELLINRDRGFGGKGISFPSSKNKGPDVSSA